MNLVKRLPRPILALLGVTALSASMLTACSGDSNDAIAPDFPVYQGHTWCVYPQGAQQACNDAKDKDEHSIPPEYWVQAQEPTGSYNVNDSSPSSDVFFWLWMMGHMGYYDSPNFINHYHMGSDYTSRVSGYETKYRSTIDTVSTSPTYSTYKSSNGKTYTGKQMATNPELKNRLSNDRKNKPLQCSAGEITYRVDFANSSHVATKGPGGGGKPGGGSRSSGGKSSGGKSNSGKPSGGKSSSGSNNKPTKAKNPC